MAPKPPVGSLNPAQKPVMGLPTGSRAAPPFIHPEAAGITPEQAYAAGVRARQAAKSAGSLTKVQTPVGGVPAPSIPRLDHPHQEGMTMQQNAIAQDVASRPHMFQPNMGPGGIVEMPQVQQAAPRGPADLGIMPTDTLPEQATKDPKFQQGFGNMLAVYQPNLALAYGVIRQGQYIPPQKLQPQRSQLRPETVKDMETLAALQEQTQANRPVGALHETEAEADASFNKEDGAAAAAARAGNVPGDGSNQPLTEKERKKLDKALGSMDEFDLDSFRQAMMRDILNNPEQKDLIEARLEELSLDELIVNNRVTQVIPIIPSMFSITLHSMTGEEDMHIKRLIMDESKSVEVSERYLLDKYSFMSIAVGLAAINGKAFGRVENAEGNWDDAIFWAKYNRIIKLPLHMLASIGVNLFWFEARVRKLFVAEKVGNG